MRLRLKAGAALFIDGCRDVGRAGIVRALFAAATLLVASQAKAGLDSASPVAADSLEAHRWREAPPVVASWTPEPEARVMAFDTVMEACDGADIGTQPDQADQTNGGDDYADASPGGDDQAADGAAAPGGQDYADVGRAVDNVPQFVVHHRGHAAGIMVARPGLE